MKKFSDGRERCCNRGGSRPGCGRKPGVKTRPVRLPEWLLDELEQIDDPRQCIVQACIEHFDLEHLTNNKQQP
ncbi:hypothetical protein R3X26_05285 [Vibrio sp. TH_r3]|uniref:hypothetical protein n=1 Tax=Vibrio sp. TH_r3 TaxID=3082084 RepID=UPI0029556BB3|nr:hypothetical protein [Vibrio sp. TH_r3]MDV7103821.1 hypothetical protein [Vibrio sp. TH_r3]